MTMRVSPTIEIRSHEVDLSEGNKLAYVAQLYRGTVQAWPATVINIVGSGETGFKAQDRLSNRHGIPRDRVKTTQVYNERSPDLATIGLIYFPAPVGTRKVYVEFKLELGEIFNVEFEVSPDGAYVSEVSVQLDVLKKEIVKRAFGGRVKTIKIATKPTGIVGWDREVSDKVKTELKAKIKSSLSGEVSLPGPVKVTVELYGSLFSKLQEDGVIKHGVEGGLVLSVPL